VDFEKLKQSLDRYCLTSELNTLRSECMPVMKAFRKEIETFTDSHGQMKEMIRRFDEIISDKASKVALIELENQVE
jgi:flavorubredoxin